MNNSWIIQAVDRYFEAFSSKKLDVLSDIYHKDIILTDWLSSSKGREAVLSTNANLFQDTGKICIDLKEVYIDGLVSVCEIGIEIDGSESINVVDIIHWSADERIIKIDAYKK